MSTPTRTPVRNVLIVAALIAVVVTAALQAQQNQPAAAKPTAQPTRVAVVDIQAAFSALDERKAVEAAMLVATENTRKEAERREIELRQRFNDLQALKPDTQAYRDARLELERQTIEFRVWFEVQGRKIEMEKALHLENLYHTLIGAIEKLAASENYDLVLHRDDSLKPQERSAQALSRMMVERKVLFASDAIDLTDRVVVLTNNDFNLRRAAQR